MKNISLQNPATLLSDLFKRYIVTIFIIIVVGLLAYCVTILTDITQKPLGNSVSTTDVPQDVIFNATTVDKIDSLDTSNTMPSKQILPTTRIDPFLDK